MKRTRSCIRRALSLSLAALLLAGLLSACGGQEAPPAESGTPAETTPPAQSEDAGASIALSHIESWRKLRRCIQTP